MEGSTKPADEGGEPPFKRCRMEEEAFVVDLTGGSSQEELEAQGRPSGPACQPPQLLESQRLQAKAAELRKQAAEGQAAREAAAAAAKARQQAAAERIKGAGPHVAAAEQRAREDAQAALESARSSIEAAAAAITASAEQQAALSRALGQDGAAVERQLERARAAAAAAAAAAKARLDSEVQEAVKVARARAEVAYGVVKAQREAVAAEAAAAAALAGWPAEQQRLLEEAARLEQQAALVAELEVQRGSALVQALATSGCLPLIAGCLGDAPDKVHFALSCKALLRQYRQDEAAWLGGLHVSLCGDVAACEQQLQRFLQRVPAGSIASLCLVQQRAYNQEGALIAATSALHQGLQALDIQLLPHYTAVTAQFDCPLLRSARLEGTWASSSTFSLQAPVLQSLSLSRCTLAGQVPQLLTHLDLREVHITEPTVPSIFTATQMLSLHLCSVRLVGGQDWGQLTTMRQLTCLTLYNIISEHRSSDGQVLTRPIHVRLPAVLAGLPYLEQLTLTDVFANFLSGINAPLSSLVFSLSCCYSDYLDIARLARITTLHTLVCTGCRAHEARQIRALTHIPNLIVR